MKKIGEVISYVDGKAWAVQRDGSSICLGCADVVEQVILVGHPIRGEIGEIIGLERRLRSQPKPVYQEKSAKMVEAGRKAALTRKFNIARRGKGG